MLVAIEEELFARRYNNRPNKILTGKQQPHDEPIILTVKESSDLANGQ